MHKYESWKGTSEIKSNDGIKVFIKKGQPIPNRNDWEGLEKYLPDLSGTAVQYFVTRQPYLDGTKEVLKILLSPEWDRPLAVEIGKMYFEENGDKDLLISNREIRSITHIPDWEGFGFVEIDRKTLGNGKIFAKINFKYIGNKPTVPGTLSAVWCWDS